MSLQMKLYVLVRKNLSPSQQAVQAGHAVAEFTHKYPDSLWNRGTLVYLGVEDEGELNAWLMRFQDLEGLELAVYREEYFKQSLTAVAVVGEDEVKTAVRSLKLI